MRSNPEYHSRIHPALTSFADEVCATLARLIAYVGALALFAIVCVHFFDQLHFDMAIEPADQPGFVLASRSRPAFAVRSLDSPDKSESYEIFRHPDGGRKDVFHWGLPEEKPIAEPALEISGWSCQGSMLVARRSAIGCMLDRLALLAPGDEPKLAELFARSELKRSGCGPGNAVEVDWVTGAENFHLRGSL